MQIGTVTCRPVAATLLTLLERICIRRSTTNLTLTRGAPGGLQGPGGFFPAHQNMLRLRSGSVQGLETSFSFPLSLLFFHDTGEQNPTLAGKSEQA